MNKVQRLYLAIALMVIGSDQFTAHFIAEPSPVMGMIKWFGLLFVLIAFVSIDDNSRGA